MKKNAKLTLIMIGAGLLLFFFLQAAIPSLQFIGVSALIYGLGLGAWWLTDLFYFPFIDFPLEIKNGNVAAAVTMLACFMLIGIAMLCAFAVFFTLKY